MAGWASKLMPEMNGRLKVLVKELLPSAKVARHNKVEPTANKLIGLIVDFEPMVDVFECQDALAGPRESDARARLYLAAAAVVGVTVGNKYQFDKGQLSWADLQANAGVVQRAIKGLHMHKGSKKYTTVLPDALQEELDKISEIPKPDA